MRFLVDAQLPRRLVRALDPQGQEAIHTLDRPAWNTTTDGEICRVAGRERERRILVDKDADFVSSHLVRGTPRRLLAVRTGDIDNPDLLALVTRHLASLEVSPSPRPTWSS